MKEKQIRISKSEFVFPLLLVFGRHGSWSRSRKCRCRRSIGFFDRSLQGEQPYAIATGCSGKKAAGGIGHHVLFPFVLKYARRSIEARAWWIPRPGHRLSRSR